MVILLADATPLVGAVLIPIALKYNYRMAMRRRRRILGIIILLVSLALLIWGLWPLASASRLIPVPPSEMQLPTPQSLWWAWGSFL
jgi:hypothetical protein